MDEKNEEQKSDVRHCDNQFSYIPSAVDICYRFVIAVDSNANAVSFFSAWPLLAFLKKFFIKTFLHVQDITLQLDNELQILKNTGKLGSMVDIPAVDTFPQYPWHFHNAKVSSTIKYCGNDCGNVRFGSLWLTVKKKNNTSNHKSIKK